MALEKWIRVKPLKNPKAVDELRNEYGIKISKALETCIRENNGGKPRPKGITFRDGFESDVKLFLSYNRDDTETIYNVIDFFIENYKGKLVPFATDSCGNYYCEKDGNIVYWEQSGGVRPVCRSFGEFLDSLYDI